MKRRWVLLLALILGVGSPRAAAPTIAIDASSPAGKVSPLFYGLMTEEINHAIKMFSTHLGDEILKATATDTDVLVSVTRDSRTRTLYVKLVNPGEADAPVQLDVRGGGTLAPTATAVTLAADPQATNAIDAPDRVVPVTSTVTGVEPGFTYTVPAHGIVVLMLAAR